MPTSVYRFNRPLRTALAVGTALVLVLMVLSFFAGGSNMEKILFTVLFFPFLLLTLEAHTRRVTAEDSKFRLKTLFKSREIDWPNITHVGVVRVGGKVYLVLTTTRGFHVLSNAYEDFYGMAKNITDHVEGERVEDEVRNLLQNPVISRGNILSAWAAVALFCAIILMKLFVR